MHRLAARDSSRIPLLPSLCIHVSPTDPSAESSGTNNLPKKIPIILPSSHIRNDLAQLAFFRKVVASSSGAQTTGGLPELGLPAIQPIKCIDAIPIVRARSLFYRESDAISVPDTDDPLTHLEVQVGDIINIIVNMHGSLYYIVFSNFLVERTVPKEFLKCPDASKLALQNFREKVLFVFEAHHRDLPTLYADNIRESSDFQRLLDIDQPFISCIWNQRTSGLRRNGKCMLVTPADILVLIEPVLQNCESHNSSSDSSTIRFILVFRLLFSD